MGKWRDMEQLAEFYRGKIAHIHGGKGAPEMHIVFEDKSEIIFELTVGNEDVKLEGKPDCLARRFSGDLVGFKFDTIGKSFKAKLKDGSIYPLDLSDAGII
jgi:hypothetical protein